MNVKAGVGLFFNFRDLYYSNTGMQRTEIYYNFLDFRLFLLPPINLSLRAGPYLGTITSAMRRTTRMFKTIRNFVRDETGATAIEYGLIAGLVSVAAILALQALGDSLNTIFTYVSTTLSGAVPAP
jgi:pilus assembly protein Flp/PilA